MIDLEEKRKNFIRRELWLLTYSAAFQHALIYTQLSKVSDTARREFKEGIFGWCNQLVESQYHSKVNEEQHIQNIKALIHYTSEHFSEILNNQKIRFGIAQKILNLYLKYLWCIGDIPTPPHFPVDRIIQDILNLPERYKWTKMDSVGEYKTIIRSSKQIQEKNGYSSLAEMELKEYSRL